MSNSFEKLPSVRSMMKLILVLLLALVAISIVLAILKALTPLIIVVALIAGGVYAYQKLQASGSKS
jgi:flagellar biogenesis protein FliO